MSYIDVIAEDRKLITYRPSWNLITGSVTASIFLQQVIYWWTNNGRKPFYKFAAPCPHESYREGDSWQEELGFTRSEFDGARAKVATKRRKGEPMGEELVSFWIDQSRKTWYTLNEVAVENALSQHYLSQESRISQSGIPEIHNTKTTTKTTTERVHAPASIDDLLPQDDLYRDGMTKAEYIAAADAERDALAPYEKAIRAVIAQARLTGDNFTLLGDTAKAYRDAGLTPEDIRRLWSTNSDSFWKAHTSGGSKPNSGKPWLGNVSGELSRAVEFLENQAGETEATALYRQWIAPLAEMNGAAREYFRGAPSQVKRALSANGMGSVEQIKRVTEQDFAGWYAGVK
jgi:hypothetical protein